MLAVLLLCFAVVIAASLLLFDVVLRRREIPRILRDLVQAVAYFITAAIVLTRSDVDVTRVFTASVLTTAVIGLALQDTLGNIMAGLALQLERDFEVGDWINVGDRVSPVVGRIREVRWRATTIVTKNGDLMLIPNSAITRAMITNFTRPTTAHRQWVTVRVHFRHPPAKVREVIVEAVRRLSFVRAEPAPDCLLQEFREDACTYACRYWIDDVQRDEILDSDVRSAIWYALHRAGMEIPFPSRNINVTEMNEDRVQRKRDEEYARRVDALARVDVFRALDAEKIDRLSRRLRHVVFGPGEMILRQGDPGDSLYVVRGGQVAVQIGVLGASKEIATLGDGRVLRRDVADDGRIAHRDRGREDRRRVLRRRQGGVPGDRAGEARAGGHHQRHPVAASGRPGREADDDARAQRRADEPAALEDRRVLWIGRRQAALVTRLRVA